MSINNIVIDEFDLWNIRKKNIDKKLIPTNFHFYEREIWWCNVGKNIGSEQNGKQRNFERPVLVFRIFSDDTLWIIPLTTRPSIIESRKEHDFLCNGAIQTADLAQLRLISSKRLSRYYGTMSYEDFQTIRKYLRDLI